MTETKLTKLGARRLLKLAKILDTADAEHQERREPTYNQNNYSHHCGTPACAWGHWAVSTPRLRNAYVVELGGRRSIVSGLSSGGCQSEFGISGEDADSIFGLDGCNGARTAKQAAKYIRTFVKRKGVA